MTASSSAAARICRAVHAEVGAERIGEIVPVLIERAEPNSLAGTIASAEPAFSTRGCTAFGRYSASGAPGMSARSPQIEADIGAAGRAQLEFDDNLLLPVLYGERDQHLDRIERQLGVSLVPRGNRLSIAGPASATEVARLALSRLYDRLKRGQDIDTAVGGRGDPAGAGRDRGQEPSAFGATIPGFARASGASRRARRRRRSTSRRCASTSWCSASDPPAPARPISPSPPRSICLMAGKVERIILSRPAVEAGERLGFLPGDLREKVDPICGRSSTR